MGSSPCIRGRFFSVKEHVLSQGLIPVYTGQISGRNLNSQPIEAHPRVYGADTKFLKQIPVVSKPFSFVLDFRNRISMYHFRLVYFCG